VDLAAERRHGDFVRGLIHRGDVRACHDISDGGLLVAVAEMVLAGGCGAVLETGPAPLLPHAFWFGEEQARYVLAVPDAAAILAAAAADGVEACTIGHSRAADSVGYLTLPDATTISLDELRDTHERFFPAWMGS
jgi:phosphoribosylformylglycinamidine synthase